MERVFSHHSSLFLVLPPEELEQLKRLLKEQRFAKGAWIFREGEPAATVWIVLDGWVHLVRKSRGGRAVTICTMTPRESLCGLSAFDHVTNAKTYCTGAMAATNCRLASLPGKYFASLIERYPAFAREVIALEHVRIEHMAEAICRAHASVECRVAAILLRLAEQFGSAIPVTHRELAQMADTTIETSIRVMGKWRTQGIIASQRGRITVTNVRRLGAFDACVATAAPR